MASTFMAMVYSTLKEQGIDTSEMTPQEAVEKFNELNNKDNLKHEERKKINTQKGVQNINFAKDVEKILNRTYKDNHLTIFHSPPQIYKEIGFDDKPFLITQKHTYLAINESGVYKGKNDHYHNLGKDLFLRLPQMLEKPIMAFEKDNDVVVVVNAMDKNNYPVIVPIRVNGRGNYNFIDVDASVLKSVHGRENYKNYLEKNVSKDSLLFVENKKIRSLKK